MTSSPDPVEPGRSASVAIAGLLVAWIGCFFAWTAARGAAFTVNLFDLAEWTTLDATIKYGSSPALVPSFLLRSSVAGLAIAITLCAIRLRSVLARRLLIGLSVAITIGLLPPFGHLKDSFSDTNYRQQLIIATVATLVVIAVWWLQTRLPKRLLNIAGGLLTLLILLGGALGWLIGVNALNAFQLHLALNSGLFIFAGGLIAALISRLWALRLR